MGGRTVNTPEQIVAGLSEVRKGAVLLLGKEWQAGPRMAHKVIEHLLWLRDAGLVERQFGDQSNIISKGSRCISARLSACWYFRLSPLGQSVRAILKEQDDVRS